MALPTSLKHTRLGSADVMVDHQAFAVVKVMLYATALAWLVAAVFFLF